MQDVKTVEAQVKWHGDPRYNGINGFEDVTFGIGEWDGEFEDDGIFYWLQENEVVVGYDSGEWVITELYK
jgi:hypothetical protein